MTSTSSLPVYIPPACPTSTPTTFPTTVPPTLAKRILTAFHSLLNRHSKALIVHTSVTDLLTVVWRALGEHRTRMPDVIAALCIDTASRALELPLHRAQVLERACEDGVLRGVLLPSLSVSSDDQELWMEDDDEYFNRNLRCERTVSVV